MTVPKIQIRAHVLVNESCTFAELGDGDWFTLQSDCDCTAVKTPGADFIVPPVLWRKIENLHGADAWDTSISGGKPEAIARCAQRVRHAIAVSHLQLTVHSFRDHEVRSLNNGD